MQYKERNEVLQSILPFKDKLYRYAYKIVGNRMAAEDVVQEVLVKVWKKRAEMSTINNKEAWCMTVTRNLSLDYLRRKKYHHEPVEDHYDLSDAQMTPLEVVASNQTLEIIHDAIKTLPPNQQQVLHLRDVEGYSYKEIAKITDLPLNRVKVYLHRARLTLRKQLATLKR